ncbi:MAG: DUF6029 family protein, partial [Bacteroidota bacterium]
MTPTLYHMRLFDSIFLLLLLSMPMAIQAQNLQAGTIRGSFQTDVQYLFPDSVIGADGVDEKILSNSFLQLTYQNGNFQAGLRYEAYLNPVLGFDQRFEGQGIPYRYVQYTNDRLDITVGNFYDQFGSGLVFRTYQEWTLGLDNSIDGVRVKFDPVPGVQLKGIIGTQRKFFDRSASIIRGADAEISLNDVVKKWADKKTRISIGASAVSKFQEDDDVNLVLPENVTTFGGRMRLIHGGFNLDAEYAYKINDPISLNNFVYNPGNAIWLNASYSRKGLGVIVSAKRLDNMDFRSERNITLQELTLNFLPPISKFHTYRLPTLYPYATQPNGEVGFQASLIYKIPRKTRLGGKYGTQIYLNYSRIHGLDTSFVDRVFRYESSFLGDPGNLYFQDFNI